MNDETDLQLEGRIHSLLCNELDEERRTQLLGRIVRDERARRILEEMLAVQQGARAAFGYDQAGAAINLSLQRLKESLPGSAPDPALQGHRGHSYRLGIGTWVWRATAAAVLVASLAGATVAYLNSRRAQNGVAAMSELMAQLDLKSEEHGSYRRIWNEIVSPSDRLKPWILLEDGGGRFEYVPASNGAKVSGEFIVVRCLIVDSNREVQEVVNLLLPADRPVRASLGEAGRLAGLALRCSVNATDEWVALDLAVGPEGAGAVGVRGRVRLGQPLAEIGRFKLGHRDLHVFVQAKPLPAA